ncbi:hypothetical protein JXC34_01465 [Candidatus Woesearchaeota archaeon]|nr:hypothetical protein [Candidatus Woesearchaeota archaeon]
MGKTPEYENYPCRTIIISNIVSLLIYFAGAFIIYHLGIVWLTVYLLYVLWLELHLIKGHCVNCYYYGKFCAFGKGKISSLLFKRGNSNSFLKNNMTWKDMLPDFLVSIIPLVAGIVILILKFNWQVLGSIMIIVIFTSAGNGFVRGTLACKFCKQRKIGCPAEQLFSKDKKNSTKNKK